MFALAVISTILLGFLAAATLGALIGEEGNALRSVLLCLAMMIYAFLLTTIWVLY